MTFIPSLALLPLIGVGTSCYGLGLLLIALEGLPEETRRARGQAECVGQPCDPDQWLIFHFGDRAVIPRAPWHTCFQSYDVEFASVDRNPLTVVSVNAVDGLALATVTKDGVLRLSEFGSKRSYLHSRANAVGVAWSNAGDRLAVARRGAAPTEYILDFLTPALDPLQSIVLELPAEPDYWQGWEGWFLVMSWNPSDALVAVSTPVTHEQPDMRTSIVFLGTDNVDYHPLSRVYFIEDTAVVANDSACAPCAVIFDLADGRLVRRRAVAVAEHPIASHPPSGVFATMEPDPPRGTASFGAAGLHTADLGPSIIGFSVFDPIVFIPLDMAMPTLVAAGFGPDDAPQPDDKGGCPPAE